MKLSIVIPAYNEEGSLGPCLQSILAEVSRSRVNAEVVMVNNASTDRTREVALSYSGVIVVDEPRKGLSRARQAGFVASSGDLVANIDADEIMPAGWITKVLEMFHRDPELLAVSGPQQFYDVSPIMHKTIVLYYRVGYVVYLVNRYVLHTGSMLQGGNFVVRRQALEAIGGFDPRFEFYGEDADLARRLFRLGKVRFSLQLPILASGRRIRAEGMLTMAIRYPLNYFWTLLFGRPYTKAYKNIRVKDN